MPTYDDIRSYFDGSEDLQRVVRNVANIPIVTGFTLDIDPLWSHLYDVENDLVDLDQAPLWTSDPRFFLYYRLVATTGRLPLQPPDRGYRRRDLHKAVSQWQHVTDDFSRETGKRRFPVVLTIVHRPLRAPRLEETPETDDTSWLQRLIRATREVPVLVRVEERPHARLSFSSGDAINIPPSRSGTLGGILEDPAGVSYGVTCSHVAQKNDVVYDSSGRQIGICIGDTDRQPLSSTRVCDPVTLRAPNPIPSNGPDVNMLDCALVRMSVPVNRPTISGVAQSLSPGQSVIVTGAKTGTTRNWLGSLCLSYAFLGGGQKFCFLDVIELTPQPTGLLGRTLVPTLGDSGAWVLTDDQPPDWAGLFFGQDGKRGFAIRAKWVHEWAQTITSVVLTP